LTDTFTAWSATTHPIVKLEDDWNNLLAHGLWKGAGYNIRLNGSYTEALNMQTGKLTYGGSGNIGGIDGADSAAVINAALAALASSGGTVYLGRQSFTISQKIVMPNSLDVGQDFVVSLIGQNAILHGAATLATNMLELDADAASVNYSFFVEGIHFYPAACNVTLYNIYVKDALNTHIKDCVIGWNGLKIEDAGIVWLDDLYCVDSYNEGILIDNTSYVQANNIYIDNCGGYGGGSYQALSLLNASNKQQWNNLYLYGQKGAFGGQASGIYIGSCENVNFNNVQIEGFKDSGLQIALAKNVVFNNLVIRDSDDQCIEIAPTADIDNLSFNNIDLTPAAAKYGLTSYAQNTFHVHNVAISNGVIHSAATGNGIYMGGDASAGATSEYFNVNNINFETLTNGFYEAFGSNADHNQINNSSMSNVTTPIYLIGTNSRVRNVLGYRNEHAGVATILNGTASIDVDPSFHGSIDFTSVEPIVMLAGQHAETCNVYWAVKDADEITITAKDGNTTGDRKVNYYIVMPNAMRL